MVIITEETKIKIPYATPNEARRVISGRLNNINNNEYWKRIISEWALSLLKLCEWEFWKCRWLDLLALHKRGRSKPEYPEKNNHPTSASRKMCITSLLDVKMHRPNRGSNPLTVWNWWSVRLVRASQLWPIELPTYRPPQMIETLGTEERAFIVSWTL